MKRIKIYMKYSFYISMSILAIINSLFFIVNWKNWEINISNEAILLSVVGFFFAFAGINIYSIFNTNIENEKRILNDLIKKYDNELSISSSGLKFPQKIHGVYQNCQYLISSKSLPLWAHDRLLEIKSGIDDLRNTVLELKRNHKLAEFDNCRKQLTNLTLGVLTLLENYHEKLDYDRLYFHGLDEKDIDDYKKKVKDITAHIEDVQYDDYIKNCSGDDKLTIHEKCSEIINFCKQILAQ
ncbi:MAG: hypothetical protein E7080_10785 [Bacteroidales bacterium]|nr:hypothetical protein [Bacteroidales bacterium]